MCTSFVCKIRRPRRERQLSEPQVTNLSILDLIWEVGAKTQLLPFLLLAPRLFSSLVVRPVGPGFPR